MNDSLIIRSFDNNEEEFDIEEVSNYSIKDIWIILEEYLNCFINKKLNSSYNKLDSISDEIEILKNTNFYQEFKDCKSYNNIYEEYLAGFEIDVIETSNYVIVIPPEKYIEILLNHGYIKRQVYYKIEDFKDKDEFAECISGIDNTNYREFDYDIAYPYLDIDASRNLLVKIFMKFLLYKEKIRILKILHELVDTYSKAFLAKNNYDYMGKEENLIGFLKSIRIEVFKTPSYTIDILNENKNHIYNITQILRLLTHPKNNNDGYRSIRSSKGKPVIDDDDLENLTKWVIEFFFNVPQITPFYEITSLNTAQGNLVKIFNKIHDYSIKHKLNNYTKNDKIKLFDILIKGVQQFTAKKFNDFSHIKIPNTLHDEVGLIKIP